MLKSCLIIKLSPISYDEPMKSAIISIMITMVEHMLFNRFNHVDPEYFQAVYETETEFLSGWLNLIEESHFSGYALSYISEVIDDPINFPQINGIIESGLVIRDFNYVYNTDDHIYIGVNFL